ncbi:MAG: CcmD family protein [Vicinamibacterales bacterium]
MFTLLPIGMVQRLCAVVGVVWLTSLFTGGDVVLGAATAEKEMVLAHAQATGLMAAALQPPEQQDEFVPVDELPAQESLPAAPLLIAAYAFVWVVVLVYLFSIWRRLGRVERDMASVAQRIEDARRR